MALKDKLVDDWKDAWRWISMNCMAGATIVQTSWMAMPDDLRMSMPSGVVSALTIGLLLAGIIGRIVKQA